MNGVVRAALRNLDVPAERIHSESFGGEIETDDSFAGIAAHAIISMNGEKAQIDIKPEQTVLSAMLTANLRPPYSCQSGVCDACRTKLTNGEVHMRARIALEDREIECGEILTCQSVARTPELMIAYG